MKDVLKSGKCREYIANMVINLSFSEEKIVFLFSAKSPDYDKELSSVFLRKLAAK